MVMVILVKIDFGLSKPSLNINYLYLVSRMTISKIENDHFDLDHFDRLSCERLLHNYVIFSLLIYVLFVVEVPFVFVTCSALLQN